VAGSDFGSGNGVPGGIFGGDSNGPVVKVAPPKKLNISGGVMQGLLLRRVEPAYPTIAKAARISGTVVLQATISKAGTIEHLQILSGPPLLQQAAYDAVKEWRYKPFLLDGEPVEVGTTIDVVFTLND
jgi:protein TonB